VALNIRFFQRHGVPPGAAMASGALDSVVGFIVQLLFLTVLLVFAQVSLDLEFGDSLDSAWNLLLLAAIVAVVGLVVMFAVGRLRRFVLRWAKQLLSEAGSAVRSLSPRRLLLLFGGNMATEILFSSALGVFVAALGYRVPLPALLIVNITIALFSGLMPITGGVGVAEAGLTFGLVQAGVPEEAAFAAVLLYRLSTFYLPPLWGYFAFRWLERNKHL